MTTPQDDYEVIPGHKGEPIVVAATMGVKFSNDIILLKSYLDQWKVEYDESDLEMTPFGLGHRIKRERPCTDKP